VQDSLRKFKNSSTRRRKTCIVARDGESLSLSLSLYAPRYSQRCSTDSYFCGNCLVVSWIEKSDIAVQTVKEKTGKRITSRSVARNYPKSTSLYLRHQVPPLPNDHFPFPSNSSFTRLSSPPRNLKDALTLSI